MEMHVYSSSPPDASLPPEPHPSLNTRNSSRTSCFGSTPGSSIFGALTLTNILLLLPLSGFILFFGFWRWQKHHGSAKVNPSDIFAYHMVAMEMIAVCGSVFCSCGGLIHHDRMMRVGCDVFTIISSVNMFFHVLTCVEQYLAVVHPFTYLSLSKIGRFMVRNIATGCVWLLSSGMIALRFLLNRNYNMVLLFWNMVSSLIIISFCNVSVLRILIRPGPGEGGGNRGKVDKSKQRAFITITAILAVLLVRFGGNLVCHALSSSSLLSRSGACVVQISGMWFSLPSSYVLPLLFLHRAGKLPACKHNTESG